MRFTIAVLVIVLLPTYASAGARGRPLIEAVKASDREAVRTLLQSGADVNAAEADGTTAMHWAAHNGDLETVEALIRENAGVNTKNRYGVAPLWLASTNGHVDVVDALLREGADPETPRAESGETPLMAAAMAGHIPVIQRLLASGADPNVVDLFRQQTALMWAAAERHTETVRMLVEAGADLEARSSIGMTPLMFAIRAGDIDTTTTLLDLGADLGAMASDGTTTLVLAILNAHWELAATLLDRGADPNGDDPRGRPLHVLALARRADNDGLSPVIPRRPTGNIDSIDLAKALLMRGANVNDRIDWENLFYTPTHLAITPTQVTTLVGATPLYIAAKNCDVEFVRLLVAEGADPSIETVQRITPLLAAAGVGHIIGESAGTADEAFETVKLLWSVGGALDGAVEFDTSTGVPAFTGWNGAGVLHGAVLRDAAELTTWLIEQGVPLDHKTGTGKIPLDLARGTTLGINFNMFPEVAEILEQAMLVEGLPVPEREYTGTLGQLGVQ